MLKFFCFPFGVSGDRAAIPDPVQVAGTVSYTEGYNFNYQRPPTDPASLQIERNKMNQLYFDITNAIAELQSQGIPDFITTALNDGVAYSYAVNALVRYSGDIYQSLVAANTALPSDATKWALVPTAARVQAATYTSAVAGGTADALTAAFTPAPTAWPGTGTLSFLVRAGAANATTTPTFTPNSGVMAPKTIVKGSNTALAPGDIAGAGHWLQLTYDPTLDRIVLGNPASLTQSAGDARYPLYVGDAAGTADALTATVATPITALYDGMLVTVDAASANATTTPTFNLTLGTTATGAKTITKLNGLACAAKDIAGTGHRLILGYAAGSGTWALLNPATIFLPRLHISGLELSTAGASTTMTIAAGEAVDSTGAYLMSLASAISKTTSAWAVGTGNGGLDTGAIANSTWYHFYEIKRLDTGVTDVILSLNATTPTLPANYTIYRHIGFGKTNGSGQWVAFVQTGDEYRWLASVQDVSTTNQGTAAVSATLGSVPTGVKVQAILNCVTSQTGGSSLTYLSDLAANDEAPVFNAAPGATYGFSSTSTVAWSGTVRTNTAAQIRTRLTFSDAGAHLYLNTLGFIYDRRSA